MDNGGIRQLFPQINWFLLRGLGRESGHWHDFLPLLQKAFPDDVFLCLDQAGSGQYWKIKSPKSMAQTVNFVRAQYQSAERHRMLNSGPSFFIGLSLGAMIAVAWGAMYPQEFRGAVLVNTSLPRISLAHHRLHPSSLISMLSTFIVGRTVAAREKRLLSLVSNDPIVRKRLLPSWVRIQQKRPVSGMNYMRMLSSALSFTPPAESPFSSTLILKSTEDRLINSRCSDEISDHWHVPMRTHPSAGHDLSSDDPKWVVEQIRDWLG